MTQVKEDSTKQINASVADKLTANFSAGDIEAYASSFFDDAVIWHSFDCKEQPKSENIALLKVLFESFDSLNFENVTYSVTDEGFVQQHIMTGRHKNGKEFSIPACLVVTVKNEKILRLDEYIDPTSLFECMEG